MVGSRDPGPTCDHCPATEANCALRYPCCGRCSHSFGEGDEDAEHFFTCAACSHREPRPGRGRPKLICPACGTDQRLLPKPRSA